MKNKERKPNIIFLSIDGLRSKNLGCYGYKRNTTPNIDFQSKQGTLFENFFSSHNCSHKSFLSILGGRHFLTNVRKFYPTSREMKYFFETGGVLLQEILKKQGYKTHFLQKLFGWQKKGFDYYFKQDGLEESKKWSLIKFIKKIPFIYSLLQYLLHNTYLLPRKLENKIRFINDGERATNKAIEIIKENKEENFFLWIHFMDSHLPHFFPNHMINKFLPNKEGKKIFEILNSKGYPKKEIDHEKRFWKFDETIGGITARYDTGVLYDDFLVGKIINTLKEEGLLKDTIIFLFADHGMSMGEHEAYFNTEGMYDVSLHIPLVMVGKGIPKDKKINSLTQLEDLAPTVLDLIGVKYDPDTFDGKSLLPLLSGEKKEIRESIFMEESAVGLKKRAIRAKKHKYMESPDKENLICENCNTTHGPITALYDLEKDPDETVNVAEKNKKITKEMKSKLDKTLRDLKTLNEKRKIQIIIKKNKLV